MSDLVTPTPLLWLQSLSSPQRGECWSITDGARVGRMPTSQVVLSNNSISRNHAEFHQRPLGWVVRDLGSRNGTRVNNTQLTAGEEVLLHDGDVILFSSVSLRVLLLDAAVPALRDGFQLRRLVADVATTAAASSVDLYLVAASGVALMAGVQHPDSDTELTAEPIALGVLRNGRALLESEGSEFGDWSSLTMAQDVAHPALWLPLVSDTGLRQGVLRLARRLGERGFDALELDTAQANFRDVLHRYDVFDAPSVAPCIDPAWLWANDHALARLGTALSSARDFAALPILADALEDAGCCDAHLLAHCRGGAAHTERCWVLDLLAAAISGPCPAH